MSCCHLHLRFVLLQLRLLFVNIGCKELPEATATGFRQPALQEQLSLMGAASEVLLLGALCFSCPCKLTVAKLSGFS